VPLQESEAFLEGALVFIHGGKMEAGSGRARRYDISDRWRVGARFGG
jgi:carboxylesterase type B